MLRFCQSMHEFLSEDPENVVAIHCKGGKGRTGTLICTWLVECGQFDEAQVSPNRCLACLFRRKCLAIVIATLSSALLLSSCKKL